MCTLINLTEIDVQPRKLGLQARTKQYNEKGLERGLETDTFQTKAVKPHRKFPSDAPEGPKTKNVWGNIQEADIRETK